MEHFIIIKKRSGFQMQKEFEEIYGQAVDEALLIIGQNIANIIRIYVYEKHSIRLSETFDNPNYLTEALESTLDAGSRIIHRRILRLLYHKMGMEPQFALTTNFDEKVVKAKEEFDRKNFKS
jgi:hypothetical protein